MSDYEGGVVMASIPKIKLTLRLSNDPLSTVADSSVSTSSKKPKQSEPSKKKIPQPKKAPENISDSQQPISRLQNPDSVALVQSMKSFECRKWKQSPLIINTLLGYNFQVPSWLPSGPPQSNQSLSKKPSLDLMEPKFMPTFVCTLEDCHKIFDSREKWRRHQAGHSRRKN